MNEFQRVNPIAPRLRAMRQARGLTMFELAALTEGKVSLSTINRLEKPDYEGTFTMATLEALADALECTTDELTGQKEVRVQLSSEVVGELDDALSSMGDDVTDGEVQLLVSIGEQLMKHGYRCDRGVLSAILHVIRGAR